MEYHFGRYEPPPAAPRLPRALLRAVDLPDPRHGASLRLPPAPPHADRLAELPLVRDIVAERTDEGTRWAGYMDERGATSMWWGAARETRQGHGPLRALELRAALVAGQLAGLAATYAPGQTKPDLPRPFHLDPAIELLGITPRSSSYPSGHTRQAYLSARIVARLDPSQADRAYDLAGQVAHSRLYNGAHLPSDVAAGARLGIAVGDAVVGAVRSLRIAAPVAAAVTGGAALIATRS